MGVLNEYPLQDASWYMSDSCPFAVPARQEGTLNF